MKTLKYLISVFIIIAFLLFSCAPSAENATRNQDSQFGLIVGFWHGIIIPFSLVGKLIGLPIGILDRGKILDPSYIVGYGYALYLYLSIIIPMVEDFWSWLKEKRY